MVTFLHAADLHIGLGFTRFDTERTPRVRGARLQALERVVKVAKDTNADFLLIAGDLFDDVRVDRMTAERTHAELEKSLVPVFVLPGNHDPLQPGSVWERSPWNRDSERVRVLRAREPVPAPGDVMLYPCPVFRRTSLEDPTSWIDATRPKDVIRIGVAHGSIKDRENLPIDDHLISVHAATEKSLDYLALGHWHTMHTFEDPNGVRRTAYPGVHEPMAFPGQTDVLSAWSPQVTRSVAQESVGGGSGQVLAVEIAKPGAHPRITSVATNHLTWIRESYELHSQTDVDNLVNRFLQMSLDRTLFSLTLTGILGGRATLGLDALEAVLQERCLYYEIDRRGLRLQASEEEVRELLGHGVLRDVLRVLLGEASAGGDAGGEEADRSQRVARRAVEVLYRVAQEVRP